MNVQAFEAHRVALTGHCYRMLGSVFEADDAVQETMVRAWKHQDRFEDRASVKTWLYRIATNVCIDALSDRKRRIQPIGEQPVGTVEDVLEAHERTHWLEPVPDARVIPADADPAERLMLRQSIRLAFMAAMQHLPPKQRAVLLLAEVLGESAAEVATTLDMTVAAVNSALQRARATLAERNVGDAVPLDAAQLALVDRYVAAFERYDVDELVSLMREDATLCMPPYSLWLQGRPSLKAWLTGPGAPCRGSRVIRIAACGSAGYAQYRRDPAGGHKAWALAILELEGTTITNLCSFLDVEAFFPLDRKSVV